MGSRSSKVRNPPLALFSSLRQHVLSGSAPDKPTVNKITCSTDIIPYSWEDMEGGGAVRGIKDMDGKGVIRDTGASHDLRRVEGSTGALADSVRKSARVANIRKVSLLAPLALEDDDDEDDDDCLVTAGADDNINEAHNNYVSSAVGQGGSGGAGGRLSSKNTPMGSAITKTIQSSSAGVQGIRAPLVTRQYGVKIKRLSFGLDKRLTTIDEKSSAVLKYRTPHFRALAVVEVPPLLDRESIQIGWIQVCTNMQFINVYGNMGITSWEFPELISGKYRMISDADGKQYPWYGTKSEVKTLNGPVEGSTTVTVHMNDNFFPQVTWYIPHNDFPRQPSLTNIYRKQRFYAYLVLRDLNTRSYHILRTVTWSMELAIDVNPTAPLGSRGKLLGPFEQEPPRLVDDNALAAGGPALLENNALNPPNANSAQVLVWRPRNGPASVIVAPIQTTMNINKYLATSADYSNRLFDLAASLFSPSPSTTLLPSSASHTPRQDALPSAR